MILGVKALIWPSLRSIPKARLVIGEEFILTSQFNLIEKVSSKPLYFDPQGGRMAFPSTGLPEEGVCPDIEPSRSQRICLHSGQTACVRGVLSTPRASSFLGAAMAWSAWPEWNCLPLLPGRQPEWGADGARSHYMSGEEGRVTELGH